MHRHAGLQADILATKTLDLAAQSKLPGSFQAGQALMGSASLAMPYEHGDGRCDYDDLVNAACDLQLQD